MENDERFMKVALDEARRAESEGEVPIGAVIVSRGQIIARGHNLTEHLHDVTAHAEMQACVMCAGALGWSQISRIVFGAPDEKRGYRSFAPGALHPKTEVEEGVMCEECTRLMTEFFKKKR